MIYETLYYELDMSLSPSSTEVLLSILIGDSVQGIVPIAVV